MSINCLFRTKGRRARHIRPYIFNLQRTTFTSKQTIRLFSFLVAYLTICLYNPQHALGTLDAFGALDALDALDALGALGVLICLNEKVVGVTLEAVYR